MLSDPESIPVSEASQTTAGLEAVDQALERITHDVGLVVDRQIDLDDHDMAQAVASSPLGDLFVVAVQGSNALEVFELSDMVQTQSVSVGAGPWDTATDSTRGRIYTANMNDGTVSVLQSGSAEELAQARSDARKRRFKPVGFSDRGSSS